MPLPSLNTSEYFYDLPESQIAQEPLDSRDQSKLLVFRDGRIQHQEFKSLYRHLPPGATLIFNNTRVIPARMIFSKSTGASVELFLLDPIRPNDISLALAATSQTTWRCIVGNKRKWKEGQSLFKTLSGRSPKSSVVAKWLDRETDLVQFEWEGMDPFSQLLDQAGEMPLPPYISRESTELDTERYQTVYSEIEGAVAAPTAGLHFTNQQMEQLTAANFKTEYVTLHVSAGTFRPIKTANALDHPMHSENLSVTKELLLTLLDSSSIIAVGTTSMRTLESVYWFGSRLAEDPDSIFEINRLEPYTRRNSPLVSPNKALELVLQYMKDRDLDVLPGKSEIFILPGYPFKVCQGLITNFHLPGSSLLLLVAACIGTAWKRVYQEALDKGYRFLSYGDSSLLYPIGPGPD